MRRASSKLDEKVVDDRGDAGCRLVRTRRRHGRQQPSRRALKMRVALVTGGTAGIGAAAAEALHALGYRVAANYGRNQQAAEAFSTRTGIPTFAWNVADLAACEAGVARVQDALGPVEVLVNNAGITRDVVLHKMTAEQW